MIEFHSFDKNWRAKVAQTYYSLEALPLIKVHSCLFVTKFKRRVQGIIVTLQSRFSVRMLCNSIATYYVSMWSIVWIFLIWVLETILLDKIFLNISEQVQLTHSAKVDLEQLKDVLLLHAKNRAESHIHRVLLTCLRKFVGNFTNFFNMVIEMSFHISLFIGWNGFFIPT